MADILSLEQLKTETARVRARWTPAATPLSAITKPAMIRRLGYMPPGGDKELSDREALARQNMAVSAAPGLPRQWDWRSVSGRDYVTPIRFPTTDGQHNCGCCVAFGTIAAVEATYRIERQDAAHDIDLSEAQLFFDWGRNNGATCDKGWHPESALFAMQSQGVADEACFPYIDQDQNAAKLCADWQERVTRVSFYHSTKDVAAMKTWLARRGPLITTMSVYQDFQSFSGQGIYHHVTGDRVGGHCVCVVGYDDNEKAWIIKNSWGSSWGDGGFARIAYGEVGISAEMWAVEGVVRFTFRLANKATLHESSKRGPALASSGGKLFMAWSGAGNDNLNILTTADGSNWSNKVTSQESSDSQPALAATPNGVVIAWKGSGNDNLNIARVTGSNAIASKNVLPESSDAGPALAAHNGLLYMAWRGSGNPQLNIAVSRDGGVHFEDKIILPEASDAGPALISHEGSLLMAWRGSGNQNLSAAEVVLSAHGSATSLRNKRIFADSSDQTPALASNTTGLLMAWSGSGNPQLNAAISYNKGADFIGKSIFPDSSDAGPALCIHNGLVFVAWRGSGNEDLNVARIETVGKI